MPSAACARASGCMPVPLVWLRVCVLSTCTGVLWLVCSPRGHVRMLPAAVVRPSWTRQSAVRVSWRATGPRQCRTVP